MLTQKAIYEDGRLSFLNGIPPKGKNEVLVIFLNDDPSPTKTISEHEKIDQATKQFLKDFTGFLSPEAGKDWKEERIQYLEKKHQ